MPSKRFGSLLAFLAAMLMTPALWAQTAQVEVSIAPQRGAGGALTGDYQLSVFVSGAPKARTANLQLLIPKAYGLDAGLSDLRLRAVKPGADVAAMDLNDPPTAATGDDTFLLYSDCTVEAGLNTVAVSASLKGSTSARKHVCDVVFSARGRPTNRPLALVPGGVSGCAATLAVLFDTGTFLTAPLPLFGDLDWSGRVDALDLALFAEAWRTSASAGHALPLADLHPYTGKMNPVSTISVGNNAVDANDLAALKAAWSANNAIPTPAGPASEEVP